MQMKHFYSLRKSYKLILSLLCFFSFSSNQGVLFAQGGVDYGDEQAQKAFSKAVKTYDSYLGKNSFTYTGVSYYDPYGGLKGHPFFYEDYWEPGNVVYDGNAYDSIDMMYDIYKDILTIENFGLNGLPSPIQPYGPKVESFQLHGYHFIRLETDTISNIKEGFYNLMFDGVKTQFIIRRRKEIVSTNEIHTIREMFVEKDRYYIKKDSLYIQVKKKKSIIKALADQGKEIKSFIRKNGLKFRDNPDDQITKVVTYYDTLF
jgi:hypothetical protein